MDNTHPYHSIHIPHDAPFRLGVSPGKGWGAFATRKIPKGDVILQERPLFVIRKPHWMIEEEDVITAFHSLSKNDRARFLCVRDNAVGIFRTMESAFAENSFAFQIPAQAGKVHGFFLLHSRFNHSCLPNSKIPNQVQPDGCIALHATCDIEAGTEIVFCYEVDFSCRTRNDRHRILRFECTCHACDRNLPFHVLSDMRRTILRGLEYLTTGLDIDGQVHSSMASPIVDNASLNKVSKSRTSISLSSGFIYTLLKAALLDQEGLLDAFTEARMAAGVMYMLVAFEPKNREMADQAILQDGWTQMFCIATLMWERQDAADTAFV